MQKENNLFQFYDQMKLSFETYLFVAEKITIIAL